VGTVEATVLLNDSSPTHHVRKWFALLQQASEDVTPWLTDPVRYAELLALWKTHLKSHDGPRSKPFSSAKPSLLTAILCEHPALEEVAFSWYTDDAKLREPDVTAAAQKKGIPIPTKRSEWTWFESPYTRGSLAQLTQACRGKPQITWEVKLEKEEEIEQFMPHDADATPFIGGFGLGKHLVSVFGLFPVPTPFNLGAERDRLAKILTAGVKKASKTLKRAIHNDLGILSVDHLTQLTRLGLGTSRNLSGR
jgi:hypothetical protein